MDLYAIVRALGMLWVALYTLGLPAGIRQRRREEIASDVWEHGRHAAAVSGPIALPTASRFLRGVPDDISWRIQQGMQTADDLASTWHGFIAALVVLAVAVTSVVYAILHTFGYFGNHRVYAFIQVGMLVLSLLLLRGLGMVSRSPRNGATLVFIPGVVLAFFWGFMPPIALAVLAVVIYGLARAWHHARNAESA